MKAWKTFYIRLPSQTQDFTKLSLVITNFNHAPTYASKNLQGATQNVQIYMCKFFSAVTCVAYMRMNKLCLSKLCKGKRSTIFPEGLRKKLCLKVWPSA